MTVDLAAMKVYQVIFQGVREPLSLDATPLGSGGEAAIYRVRSLPGMVAKIYHPGAAGARTPRAKLEAMLAQPPQTMTSRVGHLELPQFAWPTHVVEDMGGRCAGFLMPEIPMERVVSLSKYTALTLARRALSLDDQSLPRRLTVCRNLAAAIADIHRQQHYFVDIKPQNIFMFKDTGIVCLLDNDSFSIAGHDGSPRFAATAYSSQYMAPELLRQALSPASVVDDTQDRFAMAVLMFQILNNGRHPFQGIPRRFAEEWNDDLCVTKGYYPYGVTPHPDIAPSPGSIHDCLDLATRRLFDRAFTAAPAQRPSAMDWRNHFDALQTGKETFIRCQRKPDDVLHLHFSGLPCQQCRLDELDANVAAPQATPASVPSGAPAKPQSGRPARASGWRWTYALAVAAVVLVIVLLAIESRQRAGSSDDPPPDVVGGSQGSAAIRTLTLAPSRQSRGPTPREATAAQAMVSSDDTAGLQGRMATLNHAINEAQRLNADDFNAILVLALAGDDAQTLASARSQMRETAFGAAMSDWQRFREEARSANGRTLGSFRSSLAQALSEQSTALLLDPFDREIAGNLAYYMALRGLVSDALKTALYAMSLPRDEGRAARSADWQLVGAMLALQGEGKDSRAALFAALAITPRLSALCKSLLSMQSDLGPRLKAPIEAVFQRIAERGQSEAEGCAWPVVWAN